MTTVKLCPLAMSLGPMVLPKVVILLIARFPGRLAWTCWGDRILLVIFLCVYLPIVV